MGKRSVVVLLCAIGFAVQLSAADVYLVRFAAAGPAGVNGNVVWRDDVLLLNTQAVPVHVRLIGISNGALPTGEPSDISLSPGKVVSLNRQANWSPEPAVPLWVIHVDVPAGVFLESRDEYYFAYNLLNVPPAPLGKVSMPIYRALVPANTPNIHLGTDLSANDSRTNVGIYNAGPATATATIEVRKTCDGTVVDTRVVTVAANTIVQIGGLRRGGGPCTEGNTPDWMRYTVVTVSQPSFTYVANVTESAATQPGTAGVAPIVDLAVTKTESF